MMINSATTFSNLHSTLYKNIGKKRNSILKIFYFFPLLLWMISDNFNLMVISHHFSSILPIWTLTNNLVICINSFLHQYKQLQAEFMFTTSNSVYWMMLGFWVCIAHPRLTSLSPGMNSSVVINQEWSLLETSGKKWAE